MIARIALAGLVILAAAPADAAPTERQAAFVEGVKALEADPVGRKAKERRTELFKWLVEAPDVDLTWCAALLLDVSDDHKELGPVVLIHALLGAGVFVIEHPESGDDSRAVSRAGIAAALRAYESILRTKPKWRSRVLDRFRTEGSRAIDEYLEAKLTECKQAG
jgi:hypothetical protein